MMAGDSQWKGSEVDGLGWRVLENLFTAVLLLDEHLCVRYANPAAEQLLATSVAHLLGQQIAPFFEADGWNLADLRGALQDQNPRTWREVRLQSPGSGHVSIVDYTVTPLVCGDRGQQQLLMELQPLDRLMRINREDSLFAAHQASLALVRGMAHEVKNPLGGIRGAAQLLERELRNGDLQEYTTVIIHETDRLSTLVDQMLGPRKPPDFARINIHQVLERVRMILQAQTGDALLLERDYDPSLPDLYADIDQLIQVVLNIARNAAQALLENLSECEANHWGIPRIVMRSRVRRQFAIGALRHRLVCMIEVQDNGPGVSKDLRETLFYPMVTGRSQGTGLGLPIAQSIMQRHGGLIECDSSPGHTVFRVLIPFHRDQGV